MNRYKWIVFFVIISSSLSAQEISNDSLLNLLRDKKISFSKYIRIDSLENQFLKANLKDSYIQTISVFHSFFGNYKKSIDKMSERGFMSSSVSLDSNVFNKYTPYAASIVMDSIAKNNRIVIFNESHHTPIHRVVTSSFLETFYNQGFRYLAVEGLSIKDSLINQRKFPVKNLTGYYINEPTYGDLVRNALKTGFTLVSYDFNSLDMKEREKGQANNLMDKVFKPFPDAKLLIHCGFSHGLDLPPEIGRAHV